MTKRSTFIGIVYNVYKTNVGRDDERISEESVEIAAQDVFEAIQTSGYSPIMLPLDSDILEFLHQTNNKSVTILINLCEGFRGKAQLEGHVAALFELMQWSYTGNPARTLAICQDKFKTKMLLQSYGLPCAAGVLAYDAVETSRLNYPLIVKPNYEDASLGIYSNSVVHNQKELSQQIESIKKKYDQPPIVEEFIVGREFNVAVLEEKEPRALPVSEIDFSNMPEGMPHICSYEAKWYEEHALYQGTVPICPARIGDTLRKRLQQLAVAAFRVMECRDYARIDFRISDSGEIYILEVNPNPDISLNAGYARALKAAGMNYSQFWHVLINNTLRRKKAH